MLRKVFVAAVCLVCAWCITAKAGIIGLAPVEGIETKNNGYYEITIVSVDTVETIGEAFSIADEGPYLVVESVLENISESSVIDTNPFQWCFRTMDNQGFVYEDDPDLTAMVALGDDRGYPTDELYPGERTQGKVAFKLRSSLVLGRLLWEPYEYDTIAFELFNLTAVKATTWGEVKRQFR